MQTYLSTSRSGFSTLMALGTIGVLLILVTGLATTYIRELKLSRTTYDEVIAQAGAEGMFEYAMLKVRNHREGFADRVMNTDLDGTMLTLSTDRSKNLKSSYTIEASSTDYTFSVPSNTHLILPLFASDEVPIKANGDSKKPKFSTGTQIVTGLNITGLDNLTWTIVAMSGSESVGITGSGNIDQNTTGTMRFRGSQCYVSDGSSTDCTNSSSVAEEIPYFYDYVFSVHQFLTSGGGVPLVDVGDPTRQVVMNITDPYIIIYNTGSEVKITVKGSTPFALPTLTVTATAEKNDTLQTFRFVEDKSRYYDALKYGVYSR